MQKWNRSLTVDWYLANLKINLRINKSTKIASIGSCFARKIRQYLLKNGFNYLLTEQDKNPWVKMDPNYKPNEHGSAAWDRVFNTFSLWNILSLNSETTRLYNTKFGVADLLRTRVVYPDMKTAKLDLEDHLEKSYWVFTNADVLILTLGLTEVWLYNGLALPYLPEYINKSSLEFYCSDFSDNIRNLNKSWNFLKRKNSNLKLLITLSPIHMNATFRKDVDVFSASCASKSILRAVIDDFCKRNKDVYYFPSYEVTTILCPELGIKPYRDGHHISSEAFSLITKVFETLVK